MKKSNALYVHTESNSNPKNHNYVKKLEAFLVSVFPSDPDERVFIEIDHPNVPHVKGFDAKSISRDGKVMHINIYHSNDCHIRNNGWCTCDPDIRIE